MATPFKSIGPRTRSWFTVRQQRPMRKQDKRCRPRLEGLEERTLLSSNPAIGDVFYIDMENHNLTQPPGLSGSPEQLLGNPAAPYLNSLMTPGNPNAAQTSYASNYYNVAPGVHPSEPNYVWQEAGHPRAPQRQRPVRHHPQQHRQRAQPQRLTPGRRHPLEVVSGRHRPDPHERVRQSAGPTP